jgi:hypothetical protein
MHNSNALAQASGREPLDLTSNTCTVPFYLQRTAQRDPKQLLQ